MTDRRQAQISSRKRPKQARSTDLVAAIIEAAAQVLAKEGAPRFTTARVAERAGVSVGSIYQYFPNKAAILFRLQSDEWRSTSELLRAILEKKSRPPSERLRDLVHAFIRSECEEAAMRVALNDAAPFYRDAPEAREARASGDRHAGVYAGGAAASVGIEARLGRRPDHDNAEQGRQALFGKPAKPRGDRDLRWRHGRHVLRLP
jgi:AcrR family transcriptional regulator